jgi:hypothetical protein
MLCSHARRKAIAVHRLAAPILGFGAEKASVFDGLGRAQTPPSGAFQGAAYRDSKHGYTGHIVLPPKPRPEEAERNQSAREDGDHNDAERRTMKIL